jgi:phage shock protein A
VDADGVALAAIQGLHQLVRQKDHELVELRERVAGLHDRVAELESLRGELAAMKAALGEFARNRATVALGH